MRGGAIEQVRDDLRPRHLNRPGGHGTGLLGGCKRVEDRADTSTDLRRRQFCGGALDGRFQLLAEGGYAALTKDVLHLDVNFGQSVSKHLGSGLEFLGLISREARIVMRSDDLKRHAVLDRIVGSGRDIDSRFAPFPSLAGLLPSRRPNARAPA